jgi:hypothetical protein
MHELFLARSALIAQTCRNHRISGRAVADTMSVGTAEKEKKWKITSSSTKPSKAE